MLSQVALAPPSSTSHSPPITFPVSSESLLKTDMTPLDTISELSPLMQTSLWRLRVIESYRSSSQLTCVRTATKWLPAFGFQGKAHSDRSNVVCTLYFLQSFSACRHLHKQTHIINSFKNLRLAVFFGFQKKSGDVVLVPHLSCTGFCFVQAFADQSSCFFGGHQHLDGHAHGPRFRRSTTWHSKTMTKHPMAIRIFQ